MIYKIKSAGVETTNQFHATGKTAWGINNLQAEKQILLNF
jgi:hypothetical protein